MQKLIKLLCIIARKTKWSLQRIERWLLHACVYMYDVCICIYDVCVYNYVCVYMYDVFVCMFMMYVSVHVSCMCV